MNEKKKLIHQRILFFGRYRSAFSCLA